MLSTYLNRVQEVDCIIHSACCHQEDLPLLVSDKSQHISTCKAATFPSDTLLSRTQTHMQLIFVVSFQVRLTSQNPFLGVTSYLTDTTSFCQRHLHMRLILEISISI